MFANCKLLADHQDTGRGCFSTLTQIPSVRDIARKLCSVPAQHTSSQNN